MAKVIGLIILLIAVAIAIWQGPAINKSFQQSFNKTQLNTANIWENQIQAQKEKEKELLAQPANGLTDLVKQQIDAWLTAKGFNEYGDKAGTMYTGGTPLFDEKTGLTQDKYSYILEHHPEIIKELKLDILVK